MRLYYDATSGRPTHSFSGDPGLAPPGDWIEVDPEAIAGPLESYRVENGALVEGDFAPARAEAIARVNAAAARVRARYVTEIPGQEMIYLEKEAEARRFLAADPAPSNLSDFPFLAAEVGSTAATAADLAQIYIDRAATLRQAGAALEQIRMQAIAGINGAATRAQIHAAVATAETDMEALP